MMYYFVLSLVLAWIHHRVFFANKLLYGAVEVVDTTMQSIVLARRDDVDQEMQEENEEPVTNDTFSLTETTETTMTAANENDT
jgi:hypothetical protein